jgi:UDP-N-acetylmuramate dehydrogenase
MPNWRGNWKRGIFSNRPRRQIADAVIAIRSRKLPDPAQIGNAGSFFKNPVVDAITFARSRCPYPDLPHYPQPDGAVKLAAGWLIERCGWKGTESGRGRRL